MSLVRAYDRYNAEFEDASAPLAFLSAVHPDRAMRDASEACEQKWNAFNSTLTQNPSIYRALTTVRPADAIDRELLALEALAIQNGKAIGVGFAYPVTIEQFRLWAEGLKAKGYQLAPASASAGVTARSAKS